ncbi:MAG: shikimate kinase [Acidobacteria bacterium]|nr:shikimate kinase [Acidobacteriota bacterium]MYH31583.1 shikimate kinase [Acidobacteriota bacterium]
MRTDKVFLVGFMAAGKSTVARALGARIDWRVEDVDSRIEARERRAVADIFATHGEARFRAVERAVLRELLPMRHTVVATGGGTFADPANRQLINTDGASIWLDVSFETVVDRIPPDGRRPLAADRTTMEALYRTRQSAYRHAHLRLDADRAPAGELVERILEWLGE